MKRLSSISVLCCAFASAVLIQRSIPSQDAVAEPSEAADTQIQAQLAQLAQAKERLRQWLRWRLEASTQPARKAKAKASKAHERQGAIDEEISLYPTAAQCGECHKQIYEEWSSSQHAYASISPMFHKFEQKFQESDPRHGRHLLRALPPAGRHAARRGARNAALGAQPDLARGRQLHHLPPGQGAVRQGQRRAPRRAGQDLRAGLRQRRQERHQGRARRQGHLLRQDQRRRARQRHPQGHDHQRPDHQVGVLRQLSPGRRQPRHQAGDRLGSVSR